MGQDKIIGLDKAIRDIYDACRITHRFSFVVGAGISSPEVPLASEIIEELEVAISSKERKLMNKLEPSERYSKVICITLNNYRKRWEYFKQKVEKKRISISNLLLALLLTEKKIGKIVITPNFDDFLTRSLSLLNVSHSVYDNIQGIEERFFLNHEDIQILHVHGVYKFHDICNIVEDIKNNTKKFKPKLIKIFEEYPPIVVGYSGWEGDSIMKALKVILSQKKLLNNIYWFCHKNSEVEELPSWLKKSSCVVLITPKKGGTFLKVEKSEIDGGWQIIKKYPKKLYSEEVFVRLLKNFKYKKFKCLSAPLKHYEGFLKTSLPPKNLKNIIYHGQIIKEIDIAQLSLKNYNAKINLKIKSLNKLSNNNYKKIILSAIEISHFNLNHTQINSLLKILSSTTFIKNFSMNIKKILPKINHFFNNLQKNNKYYFEIIENQLFALVVKAELYGKLSFKKEEMSIYRSIFYDYIDKKNIVPMKLLKNIIKNILEGISRLKNPTEKLKFLNLILNQFSSLKIPEVQYLIAKSYYIKGKLLKDLSQLDKALNTLEKLDLYQKFEYLDIKIYHAKSLFERGLIYKKMNVKKESDKAFEKIVNDYKINDCEELKQIVLKAEEAMVSPFAIEVEVLSISEKISDQWYSDYPIKEDCFNNALDKLEKIINNLEEYKDLDIRILDSVLLPLKLDNHC